MTQPWENLSKRRLIFDNGILIEETHNVEMNLFVGAESFLKSERER